MCTAPVPVSVVTKSARMIFDVRGRKGCRASQFSSSAPLNSRMVSARAQPVFCAKASSRSFRMMRVSVWPSFMNLPATYVKRGCRAMPTLAGNVHGVVVQITMEAFRSRGLSSSGKRTNTEELIFSL